MFVDNSQIYTKLAFERRNEIQTFVSRTNLKNFLKFAMLAKDGYGEVIKYSVQSQFNFRIILRYQY